jgi:hypothetical protein
MIDWIIQYHDQICRNWVSRQVWWCMGATAVGLVGMLIFAGFLLVQWRRGKPWCQRC